MLSGSQLQAIILIEIDLLGKKLFQLEFHHELFVHLVSDTALFASSSSPSLFISLVVG